MMPASQFHSTYSYRYPFQEVPTGGGVGSRTNWPPIKSTLYDSRQNGENDDQLCGSTKLASVLKSPTPTVAMVALVTSVLMFTVTSVSAMCLRAGARRTFVDSRFREQRLPRVRCRLIFLRHALGRILSNWGLRFAQHPVDGALNGRRLIVLLCTLYRNDPLPDRFRRFFADQVRHTLAQMCLLTHDNADAQLSCRHAQSSIPQRALQTLDRIDGRPQRHR